MGDRLALGAVSSQRHPLFSFRHRPVWSSGRGQWHEMVSSQRLLARGLHNKQQVVTDKTVQRLTLSW